MTFVFFFLFVTLRSYLQYIYRICGAHVQHLTVGWTLGNISRLSWVHKMCRARFSFSFFFHRHPHSHGRFVSQLLNWFWCGGIGWIFYGTITITTITDLNSVIYLLPLYFNVYFSCFAFYTNAQISFTNIYESLHLLTASPVLIFLFCANSQIVKSANENPNKKITEN